MQDIRIISVVTCEDEATAQAAADAVADAIRPYGGTVDTAPWTKDLAAKRKAEFEAQRASDAAERARDAAAKAEADKTAVDKVYAAVDADATLDQKAKDAMKALVEASTGIAAEVKEVLP